MLVQIMELFDYHCPGSRDGGVLNLPLSQQRTSLAASCEEWAVGRKGVFHSLKNDSHKKGLPRLPPPLPC